MAVRNWSPDLTPGSHRRVLVLCDWQISPKCSKEWSKEWRTVVRDHAAGDGSDICLPCSRARKAGKANPNCQYPDLDENFLETVDTEAKAYLLGWFASDGSIQENSISLEVHRQDHVVLEDLAALFSRELKVVPRKKGHHRAFTVSRQKTVQDVCRHLKIKPGPKSHIVQFPDIAPELDRHFIRGLFDGDGTIRDPRRASSLDCKVTSSSPAMRAALMEKTAMFAPRMEEEGVAWQGVNALDFLGYLYEDTLWRMERKMSRYHDWAMWLPQLGGAGNSGFERPLFYWSRTDPEAIPPTKSRPSDSGYDLTLLGPRGGDEDRPVQLYRTGVRVSPLHGWYFDLVPRSSIIKTGYMLGNGIGVIDRSYRGEVLVPLIKVVPDAPPLTFPCRLVQLVPRPVIHVEFEEVTELSSTDRGAGGFGSTGQK